MDNQITRTILDGKQNSKYQTERLDLIPHGGAESAALANIQRWPDGTVTSMIMLQMPGYEEQGFISVLQLALESSNQITPQPRQ